MTCERCGRELTQKEVAIKKALCYFCIFDNILRAREFSDDPDEVRVPSPESLGRTKEALQKHIQQTKDGKATAQKTLERAGAEVANKGFVPTHKLGFTEEERKATVLEFGYDPGVQPKVTRIASEKTGPGQSQLSFSIPAHVGDMESDVVQRLLEEWNQMLIRFLTYGSTTPKSIEEIFYGTKPSQPSFGGPMGDY